MYQTLIHCINGQPTNYSNGQPRNNVSKLIVYYSNCLL